MRIISTRTVILYAFIFAVFATVSAQTSKVPNISGKWWKDKTEALLDHADWRSFYSNF